MPVLAFAQLEEVIKRIGSIILPSGRTALEQAIEDWPELDCENLRDIADLLVVALAYSMVGEDDRNVMQYYADIGRKMMAL